MENKTESTLVEKVYCHTFDSLVRELAGSMVIDEKKILPKEGDNFDDEDIASWMKAVNFREKHQTLKQIYQWKKEPKS